MSSIPTYCEQEVTNAAQMRQITDSLYKRGIIRAVLTGHPKTHVARWAGITEGEVRRIMRQAQGSLREHALRFLRMEAQTPTGHAAYYARVALGNGVTALEVAAVYGTSETAVHALVEGDAA